jgi:hypothetical protein
MDSTSQKMEFASQNLTAGQLNAIVKKLGGEDEARRFLRGELVVKPADPWPVWKTIKLGTGLKTADDFRKDIKDDGMNISDWADDIIGKPEFTVAAEETEVDLVKATVAELGFRNSARRDQIYDRVKELGWEICPAEVGPQLRRQYRDQPNNESIRIGMKPIRDSGGDLGVFRVERHDSGFWLHGGYGGPGDFWGAGGRWVFVRPRKYQK